MKHLEVKHSYGEENLKDILLHFINSKLEAYDAGCFWESCLKSDSHEQAESKELSHHCLMEDA